MKVRVAQSQLFETHPMDCSLPGSSVNGILQARILEWVATPSRNRSSESCSGLSCSSWFVEDSDAYSYFPGTQENCFFQHKGSSKFLSLVLEPVTLGRKVQGSSTIAQAARAPPSLPPHRKIKKLCARHAPSSCKS